MVLELAAMARFFAASAELTGRAKLFATLNEITLVMTESENK